MRIAKPRDTQELDAQTASVNRSSERMQALWFSFLFLTFYLMVSALTTTHRMLLLEEPLGLPLVGLKVPLHAFYILAPILYLIFHAYVLLMLVLMAKSADSYETALREATPSEARQERLRTRLDNALFLQLLSGPRDERRGPNSIILGVMAVLTIAIAPLATLIVIQWSFLPYHSFPITWLHRTVVVLDAVFVFLAWRGYRFRRGKVFSGEDAQPPEDGETSRSTSRHMAAMAAVLSVGVLWLSFFEGRWAGEPLCFDPLTDWRECWGREALGPPLVPFEEDMGVPVRPGPVAPDRRLLLGLYSDRLSLPHEIVVGPALVDEARRQRESLNNPGAFVATRSMLAGRNFTAANFEGADLRGVDFGDSARPSILRLANLARASLSGAQLQGADLEDADLSGADLKKTDLLGASLRGALFVDARLDGAHLGAAVAHGADFTNAWLPGADLSWIRATGARFRGARLMGADLSFARLPGTDFEAAELQGSDLKAANLRASQMARASLQGANLRFTFLSAADLEGTYVFGARYSDPPRPQSWMGRVNQSPVRFTALREIKRLYDAFLPYVDPTATVPMSSGLAASDIDDWRDAALSSVVETGRRAALTARFGSLKDELTTSIAQGIDGSRVGEFPLSSPLPSNRTDLARMLVDLVCGPKWRQSPSGLRYLETSPDGSASGSITLSGGYQVAWQTSVEKIPPRVLFWQLDALGPDAAHVRDELLKGRQDPAKCPGANLVAEREWDLLNAIVESASSDRLAVGGGGSSLKHGPQRRYR